MEQYHHTVKKTIQDGQYKSNRTAVDTISSFGTHYSINVRHDHFPLLTTKDLFGFRWNSLLEEFFWFLSGDEHIRNLQEETSLWDAWADDYGRLDTAYGRFWRRYPIPAPKDRLDGESWTGSPNHQYVNDESITDDEFVHSEDVPEAAETSRYTFDQIEYVIDQLKNNPETRRMVVTAWHPANVAESTLPPCHFTFVLNVQGNKLNLHLTQRSGDIALGVPFNIAGYALLLLILAQEADFEPGKFSHTIVDAHIYCGTEDRGRWYANNIKSLQTKMGEVEMYQNGLRGTVLQTLAKKSPAGTTMSSYSDIADWIELHAPPERKSDTNKDHVPTLLRQMDREPYDWPTIEIEDKPIDELEPDSIDVTNYKRHGGLTFGVAE